MTVACRDDSSVCRDERHGFLVIDGLLSAEAQDELHAHAIQDNFFYENSFEWNRVWHPLTGMALLTGPRSYGETAKPGPRFPTNTAYDLFFTAVEERIALIADFLRMGTHEVRYIMSAYLYRAGWGLPWHEDVGENTEYRGAFTYYLHKQWRGNWGGELMILHDQRLESSTQDSIDLSFTQGTGLARPSHISRGIGTFVMPKANRLVVMRPNVLHSVAPVSPLAGENMRFSLAGFYV